MMQLKFFLGRKLITCRAQKRWLSGLFNHFSTHNRLLCRCNFLHATLEFRSPTVHQPTVSSTRAPLNYQLLNNKIIPQLTSTRRSDFFFYFACTPNLHSNAKIHFQFVEFILDFGSLRAIRENKNKSIIRSMREASTNFVNIRAYSFGGSQFKFPCWLATMMGRRREKSIFKSTQIRATKKFINMMRKLKTVCRAILNWFLLFNQSHCEMSPLNDVQSIPLCLMDHCAQFDFLSPLNMSRWFIANELMEMFFIHEQWNLKVKRLK